MKDFSPAIDRIVEMLNCPPGQAPELVAEMIEREKMHPASDSPVTCREVLLCDRYDNRLVGYLHRDGTWCSSSCGGEWPHEIVGWQELPLAKEEIE